MRLHLVRHGRVSVDPTVDPVAWTLDPAGFDDVWALREQMPRDATWLTSPETKAVETAQLLSDGPVGILDDLAELRRPGGWIDDFDVAVEAACARPDAAARPGWESLEECRVRLRHALAPLLEGHAGEEVVLVGHGLAWAVLLADLAGAPPRLEDWRGLAMPDLRVVTPENRSPLPRTGIDDE